MICSDWLGGNSYYDNEDLDPFTIIQELSAAGDLYAMNEAKFLIEKEEMRRNKVSTREKEEKNSPGPFAVMLKPRIFHQRRRLMSNVVFTASILMTSQSYLMGTSTGSTSKNYSSDCSQARFCFYFSVSTC